MNRHLGLDTSGKEWQIATTDLPNQVLARKLPVSDSGRRMPSRYIDGCCELAIATPTAIRRALQSNSQAIRSAMSSNALFLPISLKLFSILAKRLWRDHHIQDQGQYSDALTKCAVFHQKFRKRYTVKDKDKNRNCGGKLIGISVSCPPPPTSSRYHFTDTVGMEGVVRLGCDIGGKAFYSTFFLF